MVTSRVLPGDVIDPEQDDRPPVGQEDSVAGYVADQTRQQDLDVLSGLREIDGAEGVRWKVYRVNDDDPKRNGFLDEIGASQLTTNTLRDRFGGGTYRVRGHYPNGQFAAQRTIAIALDAPVRRASGSNNEVAVSRGGSFDIEEWERRQEIRDERRRRERNELLTILIPAMAPIVAAMMGRQGPDIATLVTALKPAPAPTMPEMMQGLASLKALVPEQTTDPFDRAMKIMELVQDKTGSGVGETGWLDLGKELIRAVGPTLGPAIEARLNSGAIVTSGASGALTLSAPTAEHSSATGVETSGNPQMFGMLALLPWLKSQLAMALEKARKNSDPSLIAERILDDIPERADPQELMTFVARPDWWAQLCRIEPGVQPHAAWFAQLRTAMLAEFGEAQDKPPAMRVAEIKESPGSAPVQPEKPLDLPSAPPKLA